MSSNLSKCVPATGCNEDPSRLQEHLNAKRLEFLPYHFLLASVGEGGVLRYQVLALNGSSSMRVMQQLCSGMERSDSVFPALQDTSTGQLVAQTATKLGTCNVMRQNPWNACLALGHPNGVVTMWSPNVTVPLVRMLCHRVSRKWTDHATATVAVTQLESSRVAQPLLVSTPGPSLNS